MARTTTTTFTCDSCGKKVERRELRKFVLEEWKLSGTFIAGAATELCTDCEEVLHTTVRSMWPAEEAEKLDGLVRP
jgi:hypothetical protein